MYRREFAFQIRMSGLFILLPKKWNDHTKYSQFCCIILIFIISCPRIKNVQVKKCLHRHSKLNVGLLINDENVIAQNQSFVRLRNNS